MATTPQNRPLEELRIGSCKAAIWANDVNGSVRYNVTFSRIYRTADGWGTTRSFGRDDLLVLAKLADQAHSRIFEMQGAAAEADTEGDSAA